MNLLCWVHWHPLFTRAQQYSWEYEFLQTSINSKLNMINERKNHNSHYITIPWWFSDFVLIKVRIMQLWIIRIDTRMYVSRKYHLCISIKNSLQRHIRLRCYLKWIKNSIDCNAIELLTCLCILPTLTEMKNDQINMSWAKKFYQNCRIRVERHKNVSKHSCIFQMRKKSFPGFHKPFMNAIFTILNNL